MAAKKPTGKKNKFEKKTVYCDVYHRNRII